MRVEPLLNSPEDEQERLCRNRVKSFKSPQNKFLGKSLRSNRFGQRTHYTFDKAKVKIELSVRKSIWRLECDRDSVGLKLSPSNGLRILNKDFTRFLRSFLSRQHKKPSIGRVGHTILKTDVYSYDYSWIIEKIIKKILSVLQCIEVSNALLGV